MSPNKNIIQQFELLINQIKFDIDFTSGKQQLVNTYRLRAINKVIDILRKFSTKITSIDQLKGIKNIGKKTLERIDEILKTGKLSEIELTSDNNTHLKIIENLETIIGIGRKKAYELYKYHNIQSIDDLKKQYKNGSINLPDNIIKGLKYVGKVAGNIPRTEIDELSIILYNTATKIDPRLFCIICGSYRRQKSFSGDVDVILTHSNVLTKKDIKNNYIEKFVNILKNKNIIIDSLTSDDVYTKYMGIYKLNNYPLRRIDIRFIQYESFYSAILYFTGSRDLNKKMRHVALSMNYTLNEYGLFDENNKMFDIKSEKNIFDILGLEYLTPDKRN